MNHYVLGTLTIDTDQKILLKHGIDRIPLAHKPTGILLLLLENAGSVITRTRIRDTFWNDSVVGEAVISRNISLIRTLLRRHADDAPYIETISKTGYRFIGCPSSKLHPTRDAHAITIRAGRGSQDRSSCDPVLAAGMSSRPPRTMEVPKFP